MNELQHQQRRFAGHIRDPEGTPAPEGVEDRRMAIYRELFFNNVLGLVSAAFPVCREVLGEDDWTALVRRFFREHRFRTPLFHEVGGEFVEWVAEAGGKLPPWLPELAHYEWIELELATAEGEAPPATEWPAESLPEQRLEPSPVARLLGYHWSVHRISGQWQPDAPEPTWLLVHRDADDEVHFTLLEPASAWLLQQIEARPGQTVRALAEDFARETGSDMETVLRAACSLLSGLCAAGALRVV
ncbi:MAG: DUF2063 domain-containing protein [Gammaproteobacteria bacterium]|nr:MAG: DUF2063 domain-containing protein [Gammaproteobacteria bacterium]